MDATLAFHVASMFQQIDVAVCLRPAHDTFREEMVGALIAWISDMTHVSVGPDSDLIRRLLWRVLNEPRRDQEFIQR